MWIDLRSLWDTPDQSTSVTSVRRNEVSDRVSIFGGTPGAKSAAALLVLTTFYQPQNERPLPPKPKFEPIVETFIQPQKSYLWAPYDSTVEVFLLKPQPKVFSDPETFVQPQKSYLWPAYDSRIEVFLRRSQDKTFVPPEAFVQPQKSYLWPPYVAGVDIVPRSPKQFFGETETFVQPAADSLLIALTSYAVAYNPATDVRFGGNAKVIGQYEAFVQPRGPALVTALTAYAAYNPALDLLRPRYARIFYSGDEVFDWSQSTLLDVEVVTPPVIIPTPSTGGAIGGGGGRKHTGFDENDAKCKKKKEEELEAELRQLYREIARGEVPNLAARVEEIVEPYVCGKCGLTKTDILEADVEAKAAVLSNVSVDSEIAIRLAHDELQRKKAQKIENMRRIKILLESM